MRLSAANLSPRPNLEKERNLLRIGPLKQSINVYLSSRKTRIYILIDRIDEFLIKDEYDIQRHTLQGLLGCERNYRAHHSVKVKLFLRRDLFRRIDVGEFGADKVVFDSLELVWTAEEIRDFLAKRILRNYLRVLGLSNFQLRLNEENLYVDQKSNESLSDSKFSLWSRCGATLRRFGRKFKRILKHNVLRVRFDKWEGRRTNFTDEINNQILQTFFPAEVWRADPTSNRRLVALNEFLSTHFNLSSGNTTPRILLMFAQRCVDSAAMFYQKNPDIAEAKPFPVLPKDVVLQAYEDFKRQLWSTMAFEASNGRQISRLFKASVQGKARFRLSRRRPLFRRKAIVN